MTRIFTIAAFLCLAATGAGAQDWNGPNPLESQGIGIMYWQHPLGDGSMLPCTHLAPQHPGGHATTIPCAHMVQQHPGGHPTKVPCVHLTPLHANGDPVMVPCLHLKSNGQPQHPGGHQSIAPCTHPAGFGQVQHPNGHPVFVACTHLEAQHPAGDDGPVVPCAHMVQQHPAGHPGPTAPCAHMVQQHPGGHPGPKVPCAHPMPVKRHVTNPNIYFYTDDAEFQKETLSVVKRLAAMNVHLTTLRPLHMFYREPYPQSGYPEGATNPTWPHYNSGFHSVQVQPTSGWKETLHHEIGHSTLGNSCVQIVGGGGMHTMTGVSRPGVAMSEGWAHFVGLVISNDQNQATPIFKGFNWEAGTTSRGDSAGKPSSNVEFRVGCTLWDLFDKVQDGADSVTLSFADLYRVYSPSLQLLTNGPFIPNLPEYLKRLKANHPALATAIDAVNTQNTVGEAPSRSPMPRPRNR